MDAALATGILEDGPEGFSVIEDGPVGLDFKRPGGEPLTDVSRALMTELGYCGGYFRAWARPGEGVHEVGVLALDFAAPEAAGRFRNDMASTSGALPRTHDVVVEGVPGAVGQAKRFSDGVSRAWVTFALGRRYFLVEADTEESEKVAVDLASEVARAQYDRARRG